MNITRLNVFATETEADEIRKLADAAQRTPCIAFSMGHGLKEGGLSGQAWNAVHRATHACALAHGLPDFEGFYGIDLSNLEFIKP